MQQKSEVSYEAGTSFKVLKRVAVLERVSMLLLISVLSRSDVLRQARSQKFAMGEGLFGGSGGQSKAERAKPWSGEQSKALGGQSPQPPEARRSWGGAPSARKFCIFLQK